MTLYEALAKQDRRRETIRMQEERARARREEIAEKIMGGLTFAGGVLFALGIVVGFVAYVGGA